MMTPWILLAQDDPSDLLSGYWGGMSGSLKDFFRIFGAVAIVTAAVVVWALFFRKRRRHHSHAHHHPHESSAADPAGNGEASHSHPHGRRRRRRRRHHRPRNPTLAETGGLPPVRPERPPEPFP
jgi:hypothetical protein